MSTFPFSLPQQEIWTEWLTWRETEHLNIGGFNKLSGHLDLKLMQRALNLMIEKNAALRLVPNRKGFQTLLREYVCSFVYKDFTGERDPAQQVKEWQHNWMQKPFENPDVPPVRYALLQTSENEFFMVIQSLHTNMDGWSLTQATQKWGDCYNYLLSDQQDESILETDKYLQFISESNKYLSSKQFEKDDVYWRQALPALPTPVFQKRYLTVEEDGEFIAPGYLSEHHVSETLRQKIRTFCDAEKASPFHFYLALLAIYLCRTQRLNEVVIGVPSLNRSGNKYKSTIGMFVTVLPISLSFEADMTLQEVIEQVAKKLKQSYRHAKYPLSQHAKRLEAIRAGRDRLFDVIFSYEEFSFAAEYGEAVMHQSKQTFTELSRYPLALSLCDFQDAEQTEIVIESNSAYFSEDEGVLLGARLIGLANQLLGNIPDKSRPRPAEAVLATNAELQMLAKLNRSQSEPQLADNFADAIMHNAQIAPTSLALITKHHQYNFAQLRQATLNLVEALQTQGVQANDRVLMFLHRGPEVVISMMACSLVGAAFVPLDVEWPDERINSICHQSNAKLLLTNQATERLTLLPCQSSVVNIEVLLSSSPESHQSSDERYDALMKSNDMPAYVLFTSGTTGQPKGVEVSQQALSRRLSWVIEHWGLTSDDRSLQATQINFDPALIELIAPLMVGGSVAFPEPGRLLPESLPNQINTFSATLMAFVPATLTRFIDGIEEHQQTSLRVCCCGGEVLSADIANRFIQATGARLYNVYGPTEATIFCTAWQVHPQRERTHNMPLGKAISATQIFVLDQHNSPMPFGVVGEILIGGQGLANGYLRGAEEASKKFFKLSLPELGETFVYRTGDLGWLDTDGVLHFIGRADRQVKLRGYRIELSEVENATLRIPHVDQAAAKLVDNSAIHVWFATRSPLTVEQVRAELAKRLPDYMLPNKVLAQEALPLTSNGKIDYQKLPKISQLDEQSLVRKPIGKYENLLLKIWQKCLNKSNITVNSHFFDVGGDSLSAVIMLNELEQHIQQKVSLYQLVANPTVAQLAEAVSMQLKLPSLLVSLGETTRKANLYIAASGHGDMLRFKALAKSLGGVADLHMLQPPGNMERLSIEELAALYAEKIAIRGDKSIYVAGFSVGGLAAIETAKNLQLRGLPVQTLFIVDTILLKIPRPLLFMWRKLTKILTKWHIARQREAGSRLLSALLDSGLLLQVNAMNDYQIPKYDGDSLLIKSSAYRYIHWLLLGRWSQYLVGSYNQIQIATSHSRFFEPGKVDRLADAIKQEIYRKEAEAEQQKTANESRSHANVGNKLI